MADYSPMMKQYFEVKEKYPNTILFFIIQFKFVEHSGKQKPHYTQTLIECCMG